MNMQYLHFRLKWTFIHTSAGKYTTFHVIILQRKYCIGERFEILWIKKKRQ